jgi:hypothetical protein
LLIKKLLSVNNLVDVLIMASMLAPRIFGFPAPDVGILPPTTEIAEPYLYLPSKRLFETYHKIKPYTPPSAFDAARAALVKQGPVLSTHE